jgi:hypothetical protein
LFAVAGAVMAVSIVIAMARVCPADTNLSVCVIGHGGRRRLDPQIGFPVARRLIIPAKNLILGGHAGAAP